MKQTWKKLIGAALLAVCVFALTACGSAKDKASEAVDPELEAKLIQASQSAVQTIITLDETQIKAYEESDDAFAVSAMSAWKGSRDELGAFKEFGESKVAVSHDITTVTIPVTFEKENADFAVSYDKQYQASTLSIDIKYSKATLLERAGLNTVMGIGTVFVMLAFLSFLISLFKHIPRIAESFGRKNTAAEIQKAPVEIPVIEEEEELADDRELVAVITAAIAASENTSTDGFVVRSIKKANKRNWQRA